MQVETAENSVPIEDYLAVNDGMFTIDANELYVLFPKFCVEGQTYLSLFLTVSLEGILGAS